MNAFAEKDLIKIAASFVGLPYQQNPLVGSSTTQEKFVYDLKAFDCVTFVETVMAIRFASDVEEFKKHLKALRYQDAEVNWLKRKHYFSSWLADNIELGYLQKLPSPYSIKVCKTLDCLTDYPASQVTLEVQPVESFDQQNANLIAFASTKANLDYQHVGFLSFANQQVSLIHASRKLGKVVQEPLSDFLERYGECPGVSVLKINR